MKKMFVAALTAMAMCSYSYAQDDEYEEEYEEEETSQPQKAAAVEEEEEEEEEEAPAPKATKKAAKKAYTGPSMGIGMGLTSDFTQLNFKYKLNASMMITGILGINHHGETTTETKANGASVEVDGKDNYTALAIGAGFDYFLATPVLPTSAGIELIYSSNGEQESDAGTLSSGDFLINLMFGVHADIVPNFTLSGKVGLGFDYAFSSLENNAGEINTSRLDFGIKAGVYATWFFL